MKKKDVQSVSLSDLRYLSSLYLSYLFESVFGGSYGLFILELSESQKVE